jgi:hypothetical protein
LYVAAGEIVEVAFGSKVKIRPPEPSKPGNLGEPNPQSGAASNPNPAHGASEPTPPAFDNPITNEFRNLIPRFSQEPSQTLQSH